MAFKRPGSQAKGAFGVTFKPPPGRTRGAEGEPSTSGRPPMRPDAAEDHPAKRARAALPVASYKRQILYAVEAHATVVLVGETGSGKTTQVPQYLHEAGWTSDGYQVVCTQPRRVAAVTVAGRVAQEMGEKVGQTVGYAVRFEEASSQGSTRIKYVTDGVLLREMMDDPLLSRYSVVMVDEAHERSLATDALLGLLKKVQRRRPDLRIIVSSATLEVERLTAFFDTSTTRGSRRTAAAEAGGLPSRAPIVLGVEGRTHPVQVHYLLEPCSDYVKAAVQTVANIHAEDVPGDILIFFTGQEECEAAVRLLDEEERRLRGSRLKYKLAPMALYAGLPGAQQHAALAPAARGIRKVVAATNVAETSLTIEGVVYVIDCCFVKQRVYNPLVGLEALLVAPISKASAAQRAGRAGRVRPGHCFRLCTEEAFVQLEQAATPEMQRSSLAGLVLQLKALGIDNVMRFDWLAPPPAEAMIRGLESLHVLGALDSDARLTKDVGVPLSSLPLEPHVAAALLSAARTHNCAQEMLTIAAMLAVPSIWAHAGGDRHALADAKARFAVAEGDLASFLNVRKAWMDHNRSHRWSSRHFVHQHSMLRAEDIRQQLAAHLRRLGLGAAADSSSEGDLTPALRAITSGMFMNAAQFDHTEYDPRSAGDMGTHVYRLLRHTQSDAPLKLRIHNSSVLARVRPATVVFASAAQGDSGWYEMQGVTAIDAQWLTELAPHMFGRGGRD